MKKIDKKRTIITLLALIFFFYIMLLVFLKETNFIDLIGIKQNDFFFKVFNIITKLGDWYTLIIITICFGILDSKNTFKFMSLNLTGVFLLNQLLKFLFKRPRPEFNLTGAIGYSFPSGHSMVSMAFYGFIIYMIFKTKHSYIYKIITSSLILVTILLIGFSRVYLGAHYMTDVLAGFSLGIIYLSIFTSIIEKGGKSNEKC